MTLYRGCWITQQHIFNVCEYGFLPELKFIKREKSTTIWHRFVHTNMWILTIVFHLYKHVWCDNFIFFFNLLSGKRFLQSEGEKKKWKAYENTCVRSDTMFERILTSVRLISFLCCQSEIWWIAYAINGKHFSSVSIQLAKTGFTFFPLTSYISMGQWNMNTIVNINSIEISPAYLLVSFLPAYLHTVHGALHSHTHLQSFLIRFIFISHSIQFRV